MLVGLTGGIASGKSTAAKQLSQEANIQVIYTDELAKLLMRTDAVRQQIKAICGDDVYNANGDVNTQLLQLRFHTHPGLREQVEAVVHPRVWESIRDTYKGLDHDMILVVESAIIYDIGWQDRFDQMVVVHCSFAEQRRRCAEERNMPGHVIASMMAMQASLTDRLSMADHIVDSDCPLELFQDRVADLSLALQQAKEGAL